MLSPFELGSTNQLSTKPGIFAMAQSETFPYIVNVSNYLSGTDTVSNVTSSMKLVSTGAVLSSSWRNSTTVSNQTIIININTSKLQLGQEYQITVTFTASSIKAPTFTSILQVVA